MSLGAGIDGCRGGWILALHQRGAVSFHLLRKIEELLAYKLPKRVLVDMPIGLPAGADSGREIDRELKAAFGKFHSRVFLVPHREIVEASTYAVANAQSKERFGKGVSKQAWNIFPKIRELDSFLQKHPSLTEQIVESHPELCFAQHAEQQILGENKKQLAGQNARFVILEKVCPNIRESCEEFLNRNKKSDLALDDLLDATILAIHSRAAKCIFSREQNDPLLDIPISVWGGNSEQ